MVLVMCGCCTLQSNVLVSRYTGIYSRRVYTIMLSGGLYISSLVRIVALFIERYGCKTGLKALVSHAIGRIPTHASILCELNELQPSNVQFVPFLIDPSLP